MEKKKVVTEGQIHENLKKSNNPMFFLEGALVCVDILRGKTNPSFATLSYIGPLFSQLPASFIEGAFDKVQPDSRSAYDSMVKCLRTGCDPTEFFQLVPYISSGSFVDILFNAAIRQAQLLNLNPDYIAKLESTIKSPNPIEFVNTIKEGFGYAYRQELIVKAMEEVAGPAVGFFGSDHMRYLLGQNKGDECKAPLLNL